MKVHIQAIAELRRRLLEADCAGKLDEVAAQSKVAFAEIEGLLKGGFVSVEAIDALQRHFQINIDSLLAAPTGSARELFETLKTIIHGRAAGDADAAVHALVNVLAGQAAATASMMVESQTGRPAPVGTMQKQAVAALWAAIHMTTGLNTSPGKRLKWDTSFLGTTN